ncbi:MAG: cell division protein SepF [Firmicutes bacterium]|nr:cell division protein SepF [Bacillota bacterium]
MSGFWDNVTNFFFKNEDDENTVEEDTLQLEEPGKAKFDVQPEKRAEQRPAPEKKPKKSNLIAVPSRKNPSDNLEIVLFKANSYDDMQDIARHIKERKVAVVNFEEMDKDVAQRMVDFLSGAVFALDGVPRKVSGGTFIFSCSQVDLTGKIMEHDSDFDADDVIDDNRFSSNQWLRS